MYPLFKRVKMKEINNRLNKESLGSLGYIGAGYVEKPIELPFSRGETEIDEHRGDELTDLREESRQQVRVRMAVRDFLGRKTRKRR